MSSSPLVNSLVKNWLFKTAPDIDEPPFQFIHTMNFFCSRHDAAWQLRSRNPQDWDLSSLEATGLVQESLAFLDAAVQLLHARGAVCQCTVLLEQSRYLTGWHSVYRWQQYDVIMTSWSSIEEVSKRYHQNFLLCNNNKITACIADLFNSFCEEVYAVEFFKVVRQQTMGKVEIQLYICGQIISVSNSERIIKIGQYLQKLCSYEKWSSFFMAHSVVC